MWKKPDDYLFISELEKNYQVIRDEFDSVESKYGDLFIDWKGREDAGTSTAKVFGAYNDAGLDIIGLSWFKRKSEVCASLFPKTWKILNEVVPNLSFSVFSRLMPHKHVEPHVGYKNGILRASLGIIVPDGCVLGVGSETRPMREGKCLVFDDSYLHYAWNNSDERRIVLIFDFGENYIQNLPDRELDVVMKMHERVWKRKTALLNA